MTEDDAAAQREGLPLEFETQHRKVLLGRKVTSAHLVVDAAAPGFSKLLRRLYARRVSCGIIVLMSIAILAVGVSGADIRVDKTSDDGRTEEVSLGAGSFFVIWLTFFCLILMCNDQPPELVLLGATVALRVLRLIDSRQAWDGFASPAILAIGALFIFARVLEETRAVELIVRPLLGVPRGHRTALLRLCLPTAVFSAFLNNTPIVAMLLSVVEDWCARCELQPKVMMMPLSFVSILGGMCTLIGTSTNLVLNGLLEQDNAPPCEPFNTFSMTPYAAPAALVGMATLVLLAPPALSTSDSQPTTTPTLRINSPPPSNGYDIAVQVLPSCALLGETLQVVERCGKAGGG